LFAAFAFPAYQNTCDLRQRARAGDSDAQRVLAYGYQTGVMRTYSLGQIPKDTAQAIHWYEASVKQGNPRAACQLAGLYEREFHGTKDAEAFALYRRAADLGDPDGAEKLAAVYTTGGLGQTPDAKRAAEWRRRTTVNYKRWMRRHL
jgi:TPR repeat protein